MRNYTSCTDNGIVADGHPREYAYTSAYPYVVTHADGVGIFQSPVAQFGIEGMACGVEAAVRTDEYMVAKGYRRLVENDAVEVGKKVMAHLNAVAVVAVKRRNDGTPVGCFSEQACNQLPAFVGLVGMQVVEFVAEPLALHALPKQFAIIVGVVEFTACAFFFFSHRFAYWMVKNDAGMSTALLWYSMGWVLTR